MAKTKRACNVNDIFPWRQDENGNRLCAVCGKAGLHKSLKYCGDKCRNEAYIRTSPSYARAKVHRRDKGICAMCGCDTSKLKRILKRASIYNDKNGRYRYVEYTDRQAVREIQKDIGFTRRHLWEMDHIQPVCKGGGLCGLDNLRTLCIPCHTAETAALRRKPVGTLIEVENTDG